MFETKNDEQKIKMFNGTASGLWDQGGFMTVYLSDPALCTVNVLIHVWFSNTHTSTRLIPSFLKATKTTLGSDPFCCTTQSIIYSSIIFSNLLVSDNEMKWGYTVEDTCGSKMD